MLSVTRKKLYTRFVFRGKPAELQKKNAFLP